MEEGKVVNGVIFRVVLTICTCYYKDDRMYRKVVHPDRDLEHLNRGSCHRPLPYLHPAMCWTPGKAWLPALESRWLDRARFGPDISTVSRTFTCETLAIFVKTVQQPHPLKIVLTL